MRSDNLQSFEPADRLTQTDRFLICGLGSLGQYCVLNLNTFATAEYRVEIRAITLRLPEIWHGNVAEMIADQVITGDCRQEDILRQAGISHCRAILIVTSDESINIETAIAARRLNPHAYLVVRSDRQKLNHLLQRQLGNFIALEPTEITTNAFAVAALGKGTRALFNVKNNWFRVVEQTVRPKDLRFEHLPAYKLHKKNYRLLNFLPQNCPRKSTDQTSKPVTSNSLFYQWPPEAQVEPGDQVTFIELIDPKTSFEVKKSAFRLSLLGQKLWQSSRILIKAGWQQDIYEFWQWLNQDRTRKLAFLSSTIGLLLWTMGAFILRFNIPEMTWQKAWSIGVILLLGGYGDVFGGIEPEPVPGWVLFICFGITVVSLLFILGVLGLIAENLLSSRLEFFRHRLPIPQQNHTVVVGLGRVGRRILTLLHDLNLPVVGLTENLETLNTITPVAIIPGRMDRSLDRANLSTASSVITTTDDQMLNLEIALTAQEIARSCQREIKVVIRTFEQQFSQNLSGLLPETEALCVDALAAEAFAGAAFGENMLGLFQLQGQTILVAEYQIEAGDQLVGKNLAQIAYGYNVVPVFYEKYKPLLTGEQTEFIFPPDDLLLHEGDRLVILTSIKGLRQIERCEIEPPGRWTLQAEKPLNSSFYLDVSNELVRISGCELQMARRFVQNLPCSMDLALYDYQAYRLKQELSRMLPLKLYRK